MVAARDRLSVVIPAWNAARYIGEAITSVLAEGDAVSELIVVDDGSSDDTAALAARFPKVTVIAQDRRGIAAARNLGVRSSDSTLLAFIDADDLWLPGRLVHQLAALAGEPAAIVLGLSDEFVSPDLDLAEQRSLRPKPGQSPGFLAGAMVLRRETFERVGFFDESLPVGEVIAWFQHATELGIPQRVLPELVLSRRLHRDNFTRGRRQKTDYTLLAKHVLDAKRRAAALADGAAVREPVAPPERKP